MTEMAERRGLPWRWLVAFAALYVSFGATLGFLATGAPLILRVRGVELAQVGILQLINLPLGLTFLWAAAIDRLRLPALPHRLGWIALLQILAVGAILVLAASENASLAALLAIGLATAVCVATMDVALEALVVETVSAEDRPYISSAKFCGTSLGTMLGAGVLVGSYERLGWTGAVGLLAALDLVCLLPVLLYPERRRRRPEVIVERQGGRSARLRGLLSRAAILGIYFAAMYAIAGMNGLALIDLGLPLATVGLVSGTLSPLANLAMALAAGPLVRWFGTVPLITVFAAGLVAATVALAAAAAAGAPHLALAATLAAYLCASGLGVPVFNMLYRWAEGPSAGRDYALLFGAAFFASMPVRVGGPALASASGWATYFAIATLFYVAAFVALRRTIEATLADRKA